MAMELLASCPLADFVTYAYLQSTYNVPSHWKIVGEESLRSRYP